MIKRKISSLLAGAALAAVISFSPNVLASACNGACADEISSGGQTYVFSHCRARMDGGQVRIDCFYAPLRLSIDG